MGTRADFYVGTGLNSTWIGSIAWDGYRSAIPDSILNATSEEAWRKEVGSFIESREDGTKPEDGWPWPWDDSRITDCAYTFVGAPGEPGRVFELGQDERGCVWLPPEHAETFNNTDMDDDERALFFHKIGASYVELPNMRDRSNIATPGSERSGIIVFRTRQ